MQEVWQNRGNKLYREYPAQEQKKLDNVVYVLGFNRNYGQFYLQPKFEKFEFSYKLYDLQTKFINRVCKTYEYTKGNLGALLNGTKGTGKTVSSKLIANQLAEKQNMPIILVNKKWEEVSPEQFLNSIPQDIVIFIDEYEKIYHDSNDMLTIMDGALNSIHRRVFLFTTNKLYIEDNLKQRPSRLRYLKTFGDLSPQVVEEIVNDCLVHKEFKQDLLNFVTTLEIITVDIVKQIVQEVNIHQEAPQEFEDEFNVRKQEGRYNIFEIKENGEQEQLMHNVNVYPRPEYEGNEEGNWIEYNGTTIGEITHVLSNDTILVNVYEDENRKIVREQICLKIERAYKYHSNYAYDTDFYDDDLNHESKRLHEKYGKNVSKNRTSVKSSFKERITPKPSKEEEIKNVSINFENLLASQVKGSNDNNNS